MLFSLAKYAVLFVILDFQKVGDLSTRSYYTKSRLVTSRERGKSLIGINNSTVYASNDARVWYALLVKKQWTTLIADRTRYKYLD